MHTLDGFQISPAPEHKDPFADIGEREHSLIIFRIAALLFFHPVPDRVAPYRRSRPHPQVACSATAMAWTASGRRSSSW